MKKIFLLLVFITLSIYNISNADIPANTGQFIITNAYTSAINLKWESNLSHISGFNIFRSTDGLNWNFSKSFPKDCNSYFDIGLIKNTKYYYKICSFNNSEKSEFSNIVNGITMPSLSCQVGYELNSIAYPFYTTNSDSRTQFLYTKNELNSGGCNTRYIMELYFYFAQSSYANSNILTIKMLNTTDSFLTGFKNSGWTVVRNSTFPYFFQGWNMIYLSTMFYNDTTKNLLIEICFHQNTPLTNNLNIYSSSAPGMTWHRHANNGLGCNLDSGTTQDYRPNIKISDFINTVIRTNETTPTIFELNQNYPNPFNNSTKFTFKINRYSNVTLSIYDLLGRSEVIVFNEGLAPGDYEKIFSLEKNPLASGIYYYTLATQEYSITKKLVILK